MIEGLRNSSLLGVLPEEALNDLVAKARPRYFEPDQVVFRRGDEGACLFVLISGRIKIVALGPTGAEVIFNVIEPGDVFGEMSLIDESPRCADAIAVANSHAVVLDRTHFVPVLDSQPAAGRAMMAILCERIRQTTSFVEGAVLLAAPARLFLRLRGLAEQFGIRKPDGSVWIEHGFSQQELGEIVGLTRVSINRQLTEWRSTGLIRYDRGLVVVPDFDALAKHAMRRE